MKNILLKRYGNKDRIVQAHLDFLECLKPIHSSTPDSLNEVYIQCNKRLEALRALGENVDAYGKVLAPKILRVFPSDIVTRWITYSRRENISDGDISSLMSFFKCRSRKLSDYSKNSRS